MDSEIVTLTELVNKAKSYYDKLISEKGQPGGIATLDQDGKIPLSQLSGVNEIWSQAEPANDSQRLQDYWMREY